MRKDKLFLGELLANLCPPLTFALGNFSEDVI